MLMEMMLDLLDFFMTALIILSGIFSVFLLRDSKKLRGMLYFLLGGVTFIGGTYLGQHEHILYQIGLNSNFVTFIVMLLLLAASVLWINASAEIYHNRGANIEALGLYMALGLTVCAYYAFMVNNQNSANMVSVIIVNASLLLLLVCLLSGFMQNKNIGGFLLIVSVLLLLSKSLAFTYITKFSETNTYIFDWLWLYVFAFAVFLIKINEQQSLLKKSWNKVDALNLQISNMIDSSPFPIVISKITGDKLLLINTVASQAFGISKKEASFHKLKDFFVDEVNRQNFFATLEKMHEVRDYDLMVCDLVNATPFWLSVSAKTIEYNNEMAIYMAFQDITTRKNRESKLQTQADRDPLTMAWNRRYFEKFVPDCINECIRKSQNFSLLLLDADKFKNVNDTYGHKIGDKVLIELAQVCTHSLREDDVVARFGGEEFVVFLNNTDTNSAIKVAERLRQNIETTSVNDDNGNEIKFTVSIGVVSSEQTASLDILLRQVDDAMYLAKKRGRNQIALYDEQAVKEVLNKKTHKQNKDLHPIFQNEENEEISLLDNYDGKIL